MLMNNEVNCTQCSEASNKSFENFIVSETNAAGYQACLSFAKGLSDFPNPLVLCGPSPCGKTHLLYAIKNYLKSNDTSVKACVVPFDDFISLFVEGLHKKDLSEFKARYESNDVLMLDNAQFLAGLSGTQEYFAEIFYEMCLSGKRILLVSDRPSKWYKPLYDNLNVKIQSFQIVDIEAPDYSIRKKYLQDIAKKKPDILTVNMIEYLSASKRISFSALPGLFRKLCLFEDMTGKPLTTKSIIEVIKSYEK